MIPHTIKTTTTRTVRLAAFQHFSALRGSIPSAATLMSKSPPGGHSAAGPPPPTTTFTRHYAMVAPSIEDPIVLNMDLIQSIKKDLEKADTDRDGKINFEDFKSLLRHDFRHLFSSNEIEEIGELLFVGTSGHAIRTSVLLRGICHVAQDPHSKVRPSPLHLESLEDLRTKEDPRDHVQPFYSTQDVFDLYMMRYVHEKCHVCGETTCAGCAKQQQEEKYEEAAW